MNKPLASIVVLLMVGRFGIAQTAVPPPVIEVPFTLVHGAIVVQAIINDSGPPLDMMLDTGANPSAINTGTAKTLGLKLTPTGQSVTGTGSEVNLASETSLSRVQLGDLVATDVSALAINLSNLSAGLERNLAGVLGYSLLKNRVIQIDYPNHKVRFYTRRPPACSPAAHRLGKCIALRFQYHDDILVSGIRVNGKPVIANLDTGSNGDFMVTPGAITKLNLQAEVARSQASTSTGFNGVAHNRKGTVARVTIGKMVVNQPTVTFYDKNTGYDKEPWDIRIGSAFLREFQVTVDFRRGVVELNRP